MEPTSQKKILVVDDEKDLREAIMTALSYEGYDVHGAADGEEAFAIAEALKPDLILLDISMPKMNGIDTLKKLRTETWGSKIPIFIMTVLDDMTRIADAISAGATEYFLKTSMPLGTIIQKVQDRLK